MDYLGEFKRLEEELAVERERFGQMNQNHFHLILRTLDHFIKGIKTDLYDYQKIDGLILGFQYKLN
jgi:hypothetical protein